MQAECGFLSVTGEPGTPPSRFGLSMIDFMTGVVAALGCVAALLARRIRADAMSISVVRCGTASAHLPRHLVLNHGIETGRVARSAHPYNTPVQLYKTQDGWIFIMCMTDKFWQLLLDRSDTPELAADDRALTPWRRARENRDALTEVLETIFQTMTPITGLHCCRLIFRWHRSTIYPTRSIILCGIDWHDADHWSTGNSAPIAGSATPSRSTTSASVPIAALASERITLPSSVASWVWKT